MIVSLLKVIGIIFLVILMILICIAGMILFVPVKYSIHLNMQEGMEGTVQVRWSPVLLKAVAEFRENIFRYRVRMFGGLVLTNTDDKVSWIGRRLFGGDNHLAKQEKKGASKESVHSEKMHVQTADKVSEPVPILPDGQGARQDAAKKQKRQQEKEKRTSKEKNESSRQKVKRKNPFLELKEKWSLLIKNIKKLNMKKEGLLKVYRSKIFCRVKEDLKGYVKEMIRILKPKELSGYVEFGFDDPAATGQVLGMLAFVLPLYDGFLTVKPDFNEKCFQGNLDGKGKIYLISVLKLAIKVIFNKNLIKVKKKVQTILEA